jgi:phosphoribosylglycinamide formyltransferase-1
MKRRVAILISGRGSNMAALIEAARPKDFPAEIVVVISNRADAGGIEKARASGVATVTIESKPFGADRAAFEAALQSALDRHKIDLVCLGGFMRLLTTEFVQRWYGRMLNIHPSLLPSFPGLEPQAQALRAGVKISGATVHFVIPETDAGPILMQGAVGVRDDDTPETLGERILAIEHRIYPDALRLVASGQTRLEGDLCKTSGKGTPDDILVSPAAMSRDKAKALAEEAVLAIGKAGDVEFAIAHDQTIELSKGWVFFYNSKEYLETRRFGSALAGNGPIFVDRNGIVLTLPSGIPWEDAIKYV